MWVPSVPHKHWLFLVWFLHHARVVAITGKSYRIKEAPVVNQEATKDRKPNKPMTAGAAS